MVIRNLLVMDEYPGDEEKALKVYNLYKIGRSIMDKTLSSIYINFMINNDFLNSF